MVYIDIQGNGDSFYHNSGAQINKHVTQAIGQTLSDGLHRDLPTMYQIEKYGHDSLPVKGKTKDGVLNILNKNTGQLEYRSFIEVAGICAFVSREIAEAVLERAKYYCPVNTGKLRNSGCIEDLGDGRCLVKFNCDYAYFVHEFTWLNHKLPTRAKFLTLAVQEVQAGLGGV